jgi:hypothetical protein
VTTHDAPKTETKINTAAGVLYFYGVVNVLFGLLLAVLEVPELAPMQEGWWIIAAEGALYLVLGYFVHQHHSMVALVLGILLVLVAGVLNVINAAQLGLTPGLLIGLAIRAVLLFLMIRGIGAIQRDPVHN